MLENLTPLPKSSRTCKVATIAESLSDADKKILFDAIADAQTWGIKTLSRALAERGIQISDTPLSSHRTKSCACFSRM